jgi:acyl carrier protein
LTKNSVYNNINNIEINIKGAGMSDVKEKIISYIKENFIAGRSEQELKTNESLIENGIIDSTGVLELVTYIEETYSIEIADEELIPENLDSIENIVAFLKTKGIK